MVRHLCALRFFAAVGLLALSMSARAQTHQSGSTDDLARSLFEQGLIKVEQGELESAQTLFSQSEGLTPRTSTLLNLAIVQGKLGHFDEALRTLDRLEVGADANADARQLERAQELRRELLRMFGLIRLTVIPQAASVHIDGVIQPPPIDYLKLPPGKHRLLISLKGFLDQNLPITVHTGERLDLNVTLHPLSSERDSGATQASGCKPTAPSVVRSADSTRLLSPAGRIVMVVGAVLIAGASTAAITLAVTQ